MHPKERSLVGKYLDGYRLYADVNGTRHEVLYSSRNDTDPLPWISWTDPALRFPNDMVRVEPNACSAGCGTDIGPRRQYNPAYPPANLCVDCAVADLVADLAEF
jgi:hypothetical protein